MFGLSPKRIPAFVLLLCLTAHPGSAQALQPSESQGFNFNVNSPINRKDRFLAFEKELQTLPLDELNERLEHYQDLRHKALKRFRYLLAQDYGKLIEAIIEERKLRGYYYAP